MLNINLAKHYYVRNKRLHMQLYCHFIFFCLSLKTSDHLKRTFLCRNLEFKSIGWKNYVMCEFV